MVSSSLKRSPVLSIAWRTFAFCRLWGCRKGMEAEKPLRCAGLRYLSDTSQKRPGPVKFCENIAWELIAGRPTIIAHTPDGRDHGGQGGFPMTFPALPETSLQRTDP